jgi:ribosomal protein S18 acetylase RimI-like enzyme
MWSIRSAGEADVFEVVALWNEAGGPTRTPGRHREVLQLIRRDPDALIVALLDGRVVGTVIVGWDGWRCHLYRLAVDAGARRSGVATALLAEARDRAMSHGAARLDGMVNVENAPAIAFWRSLGYELDDDGRRWSLLA